jgi:hypothetical protein
MDTQNDMDIEIQQNNEDDRFQKGTHPIQKEYQKYTRISRSEIKEPHCVVCGDVEADGGSNQKHPWILSVLGSSDLYCRDCIEIQNNMYNINLTIKN